MLARFFEKTFTPDEIEVIILLALHAFRLVLERGGFTEAGVEDVREEWLSRSNPVYRVVKLMIDDGLIELAPDGLPVMAIMARSIRLNVATQQPLTT
ncbi:MAG: hypothetical protein QW123_03410 [Desulfurococcaceae archaeon]